MAKAEHCVLSLLEVNTAGHVTQEDVDLFDKVGCPLIRERCGDGWLITVPPFPPEKYGIDLVKEGFSSHLYRLLEKAYNLKVEWVKLSPCGAYCDDI